MRRSKISPEIELFDVDSYLNEIDNNIGNNRNNKSKKSSKKNDSYYNDASDYNENIDNNNRYNDNEYYNDDDDGKSHMSDNEGEEVKLYHELDNNTHEKLTEDITRNFVELTKQVSEFRDKYEKVNQKLKIVETLNEEVLLLLLILLLLLLLILLLLLYCNNSYARK